MTGAEMILVNPARKKRRSTRRMSALQRKYFGKRRSRSVSRVRSNPRRRRRSYARVTRARRNPSRKRHYSRRRVTRARRNPSRVRRYASRAYSGARGVFGGAIGFAKEKLIPGAIGAGGALAIDLAWPYIAPYAPAVLTTGLGAVGTRLALAILIGKGAEMVGGKRFGSEVMNGGILVTFYDVVKGYAVSLEPALFGTPAASQCPTAQISQNTRCCGGNCGGNCALGVFVEGLGWQGAGRQVGTFVC